MTFISIDARKDEAQKRHMYNALADAFPSLATLPRMPRKSHNVVFHHRLASKLFAREPRTLCAWQRTVVCD